MTNLLPPDYQLKIRGERIKHFLMAFGVLFVLVIAVNLILLAPVWLSLTLQKSELIRELDSIRKGSIFAEVTDIEKAIKELNTEINLFQSYEKERLDLTPEFEAIIESNPPGVQIQSLIFTKGDTTKDRPSRILISGEAQTRDGLLVFTGALEQVTLFSRVRSPISNLLEEVDIEYSLILELSGTQDAS